MTGTARQLAAPGRQGAADRRSRRRQIALFVFGFILFNLPILAFVDRLRLPSGVPFTPAYLFGAWALLILLGALNTRRAGRQA